MTDTLAEPRFVPCSGETWRDPFPMYAALRDRDPLHHVDAGDYWVLSRFEEVWDAVRDPVTFSSAEGLTYEYEELAKAGLGDVAPIVFLDPPAHTEFRRLVSAGFTPRRVLEIEPDVRAFVRRRLEPLVDAGGGDIVAEVLKPLPSWVVAHYLGVPEDDRARFDGWTQGIVAANALGDPLLASSTVADLFAYFTELIERHRRAPGTDALSAVLAAGVSTEQALGFAFTMVTGGNDTTTGLLGVGLALLDEAPQERARLVERPELIPNAVEELLRLTSPVQGLARTATVDVERCGKHIPAGRKVLLLYGSANRDEREFGPDAAQLDVTRRIRNHLAFGYGNHHCLGAAAARLMGRVTLEEVLAACPRYSVDADAGVFAPGHFVRRYESLPFSVA